MPILINGRLSVLLIASTLQDWQFKGMENIKVLELSALEAIKDYELKKLRAQYADNPEAQIEAEMASWDAPWRQEALEHYLPMGWSFCFWEKEEVSSPLTAYFIAQPLVFYSGWTQSLWVEHMNYNNEDLGHQILDVAYRTARSKHFQKMFVKNLDPKIKVFDKWKAKTHSNGVTEFTVAKISE